MGTDSTGLTRETRLGHWKVLEPLKTTELGTLYRSEWPPEEDVSEERSVAILALANGLGSQQDYRQRFLQQVDIARGLKHPHLAHIFGGGEQNGTLYATLELVSGSTLRLLASDGPPPPQQAIGFIVQAAEAIYHAFEVSGLVHGRLSLDTIHIDELGRVQVTEIGLPAASPGGVSSANAAYLSPEQREGNPPTHQSDIYSLGAILFELLTGVPPLSPPPAPDGGFTDEFDPHLLRPLLNPELGQIVAQAMAIQPAYRFQLASELITRLAPFLPQIPGTDTTEVKSPLLLPEVEGAAGKMVTVAEQEPKVNTRTPSKHARLPRQARPAEPPRRVQVEKLPLPPRYRAREQKPFVLPAPNNPQLLLILAVVALAGILFYSVLKLLDQPPTLLSTQPTSAPTLVPTAPPTATPKPVPTHPSSSSNDTIVTVLTATPEPTVDVTGTADAKASATANTAATATAIPISATATAAAQATETAKATAAAGTATAAAATATAAAPTSTATSSISGTAAAILTGTPSHRPRSTPTAPPVPVLLPTPTTAPTPVPAPTAIPTKPPRPGPTPTSPVVRPPPDPTPRH